MDPMEGDSGALGGVFDTITGTVNSIEKFGQTVGEATTWSMTTAMIWAVIIFMFITMLMRVVVPWNNAAAKRWEATGIIVQPAAPFRPKGDAKDQKIQELEDRLAAALAQIAAFTASMDASKEATDA